MAVQGFVRGAVLTIMGGVAGLGVGYNTRPFTESDVFLTQSQANNALAAVGTHMMISIGVGLAAGLVLHLLISSRTQKS